MKYLKRKTDDFLIKWKQKSDRLPLIIKGARQIGKTETIRHFASKNYKNIFEINFAENPQFKKITEDGYSAASIIKNISRYFSDKNFEEK